MKYSYSDYRNKMDEIFNLYIEKTSVCCLDAEGIIKKINYGDVKKIINDLENVFLDIDLKKRSKVAIIAPQTGASAVLALALAYLGYINVPIDVALPIEEQERLLRLVGADAVFTTNQLYEQYEKFDIQASFFVVETDFTYKKMKMNINKNRKCVKDSEDLIAILFSSGTTGEMKGIEISYNSIIYAQECLVAYANLDSSAKFLNVLPSNHIAGYSASLSCFLTGVEMGFLTEVNAYNLSKGFLNYNPTNFIMIPKIYEVIKDKITETIGKKSLPIRAYANAAMKISGFVRRKTGIKLRGLTKPIWKAAMGRNMKICGCGTAPCAPETVEFYLNLGIDFVNVYGATETGFPICAANCNTKYPVCGVGNIRQFPDIDIVVANPDEDGIGEVRVKTPLIMLGYYQDLQLTEAAFDSNGYFKTGDYGYLDQNENLYITGRMKENIMLSNGKKVSPIDVDKYISKYCDNVNIASCGVDCAEGYDEIHLFIETNGKTKDILNEAKKIINSIPKSIYKISQIHFIDKIPMTSTGKIKRFELKEFAKKNKVETQEIPVNIEGDIEDRILGIISHISKKVVNNVSLELKNDIGMDSLELFELCVALDEQFDTSVEQYLFEGIRISDLIRIIKNKSDDGLIEENIIDKYPLPRTKKDFRFLKNFIRISKLLWKFEVTGKENINLQEQYILCPNHESYFDGMWIVGNLDDKIRHSVCSMAAESLFEKKIFRRGLIAMGSIPVYRNGNTSKAIKRAIECAINDGQHILIHPEGTRTRSGELGEFKSGASKIAKQTGLKIVPICISGAYEVFPPHKKLPRLFDWKHMRRYEIQIQFGESIDTESLSEECITAEIKNKIIVMQQNIKCKN